MEIVSQAAPFEPRRFKSAVPYYGRYRRGYPRRLIDRVARLVELRPGDPVLDLGAGPGLLAVPFAQAGMRVTAADPEPAMLEAAGSAAAAAGTSLGLWQGSSFDLTPDMGSFRLVTIGRAFHWMDRTATLTMLDKIVAPDGAVAFFHDAHPDVPDNRWFKVLRDIGDKYGRLEHPHIADRRKTGGHRRYEPFLFASAFTQIDTLGVTIRQLLTADDIVGRAFSASTSSPETLGTRKDAFEADLRGALRLLSADDRFVEIAELVAVVARRSIGQEKCEAVFRTAPEAPIVKMAPGAPIVKPGASARGAVRQEEKP